MKDWVDELIERTMTLEGGYINDPNDPGGETKYGISKRAHPNLDIKALTKPEAVKIYREEYWNEFVDVNAPPNVRWKIFDMAVNMGPETARAIWESVRLKAKDWSTDRILHELSATQMKHYVKIIKRNPVLEKYLSGWTNRAMEV